MYKGIRDRQKNAPCVRGKVIGKESTLCHKSNGTGQVLVDRGTRATLITYNAWTRLGRLRMTDRTPQLGLRAVRRA